ncbi:MAG: GNAT family N-acetyltransferase [Bacteroidota bacterium]
MEISFKNAQSEDIPQILEMMSEFYAIDHYSFDAAINEKNLTEFINSPTLGRLYLIREEATTVGYIVLTFGFSFEYGGRDAFIDEFFLKATHRRKGIGTQTMELIEKEATKLAIKVLHLEVETHNTFANRLYIRQGFARNKRSLLTKRI